MTVLGGLTGAAILVALGLGALGKTLFRLPPSPGLGASPCTAAARASLVGSPRTPHGRLAAAAESVACRGLGLAVNLVPLSRWMSEGAICVDDDLLSVRVGLSWRQ